MSYSTYFKGELTIELNKTHLAVLKEELSRKFNNKEVIRIDENSVSVDDEWKDSGLMEYVVLFINKYGKLFAGSISCHGEDQKDVWEIFILKNKPFLHEHGTAETLHRSTRKEHYVFSHDSVVEIKEPPTEVVETV